MDTPPRAHHHPPYSSGGGGGREDCWSEGATEALIEAWGDRYLQLSRGNLRQKDWKEVADAVNDHQDAIARPRKTDIQCKNRIDTLKKKYKLEKSKLGPSQWTFYSRINDLIGTSASANPLSIVSGHKKPLPQAPVLKSHNRPSLTFTVKQRPRTNSNPAVYSGGSSSRSRMNSSPVSTESSRGESGGGGDDDDEEDENDVDDEEDRGTGLLRGARVGTAKRRRLEDLVDAGGGDGGMEGAFVELARAIVKFGEIYEKVESSKQQQMMELERQRMEFAKELEFQRMQIFMEAQLELEKMKRPKYASGAGKRS